MIDCIEFGLKDVNVGCVCCVVFLSMEVFVFVMLVVM